MYLYIPIYLYMYLFSEEELNCLIYFEKDITKHLKRYRWPIIVHRLPLDFISSTNTPNKLLFNYIWILRIDQSLRAFYDNLSR